MLELADAIDRRHTNRQPFLPKVVPADVLEKLHKAAVATLRSPELKKQFDSQDAVPSPMTPGEFASFVKTEQAKWGPVVVATGAKLE